MNYLKFGKNSFEFFRGVSTKLPLIDWFHSFFKLNDLLELLGLLKKMASKL